MYPRDSSFQDHLVTNILISWSMLLVTVSLPLLVSLSLSFPVSCFHRVSSVP